MRAMIRKEFRELARDRRTAALLVVVPFLLLVVFGYAANFAIDRVTVLIAGPAANEVAGELAKNQEAQDGLVIKTANPDLREADLEPLLRERQADAVIYATSTADEPLSSRTHLWVDGTQLFTAQACQKVWMKTIAYDTKTRVEKIKSDIDQAKAEAETARVEAENKVATIRARLDELRAKANQPTPSLPDLSQLPRLPALPNLSPPPPLALDPDALITVVPSPGLPPPPVPGPVPVLLAGPGAEQVARILAQNPAASGLKIQGIDPNLTEAGIPAALPPLAAIIYAQSALEQPLAKWTHLWVNGTVTAPASQKAWLQILAADAKVWAAKAQAKMEQAKTEAETSRAQAAANLDRLRSRMTQLRAQVADRPSLSDLPSEADLPTVPKLPALPETSALDVTGLDLDRLATVLYNPDLKTSWVMVPGLIGLILTFIGTVVTSIGLVRERETGTLEQLAVMPLRPSAIIMGKIIPYFGLAVFDIAIITSVAVWLFGVPFVGSIWRFAIVAFVFLFVVLGLGVLISVFSKNTGQATQMAIMMVMPQVLLSGLIFPLESMAAGVRVIGYALPLTWFNQAAQGIMLRDASLADLAQPLGILTGMAVVIFGVATLRMNLMLRRGGATR